MLLKNLLKDIQYTVLQGDVENINIENVYSDSRIELKDSLFVCIKGSNTDGHNFINDVKTAKVIVVEENILPNNKEQVVLKVEDSRKTLAFLVSNLNHNIENKFKFIGVTGTNGKTSITLIIQSILKYVGEKCAVIGTIENQIDDEIIPIKTTTVTTPDINEIYKMLNYIDEHNVKTIVMEATAHALSLNRIEKFKFEVGVFTNLTPDHLDFYKTMDNYKEAKFKLFKQSKYAVLNIDDPVGKEYYDRLKENKFSYSTKDKNADLYATNIVLNPNGSYFDLYYKGKEYKNCFINLVGMFSIYNVLAGIGATLLYGIEIKQILEAIKDIKRINGRCEIIKTNKDFNAVIDYAHSEDSLEKILKTVRDFTKGRIICLFGLGGGHRYKEKRPVMGKLATKLADFTIITDDNPRDNDPEEISRDIERDIKELRDIKYTVIHDREKAIEYAVNMAKTGDTIVCCGKGHETYQEYENGRRVHLSEHEILTRLMND